jgi:hypothetical protein
VAKPGLASPSVGATFSTVVLSAGGLGGVPGTGTIAYGGEQGDHAMTFSDANQCVPGKGGSSPFGSGWSSIIISSVSLIGGSPGRGFGSGGSGAASFGSGPAVGGNGAPGLCRVFEFY